MLICKDEGASTGVCTECKPGGHREVSLILWSLAPFCEFLLQICNEYIRAKYAMFTCVAYVHMCMSATV